MTPASISRCNHLLHAESPTWNLNDQKYVTIQAFGAAYLMTFLQMAFPNHCILLKRANGQLIDKAEENERLKHNSEVLWIEHVFQWKKTKFQKNLILEKKFLR